MGTSTAGPPRQDFHEPPIAQPRLSIADAIRRHLVLFLLPVVICVAGAAAYGLARDPVYTAETRMGVTKIDVSAPGALAGFAVASQSLAETYSRVIGAGQLVDDLAGRLRVSPETIRSRLSATPVPNTPVFRVTATGPTERAAVLLANAGADRLQSYLRRLTASTETEGLLAQYERASLELSEASSRRSVDKAAYRQDKTDRNLERLVRSEAEARVAGVKARALQQLYETRQQGVGSSADAQILTRASAANSDRREQLQLFLLLGLAAGAALGTALALLRSQREVRRLYRG